MLANGWILVVSSELITPHDMGRLEELCEELGVSRETLMENAGRGLAEHVKSCLKEVEGKYIVVVAGVGNNGGDGFTSARYLAQEGAEIAVILLASERMIKTPQAAQNWRRLKETKGDVKLYEAPDVETLSRLRGIILNCDAILDAIFGTGIKGRVREPYSTAIDIINESKAYKIAVDVPSGLDPLTGQVQDKVVIADETVTFHKVKTGLPTQTKFTGKVTVKPIGVPEEAERRLKSS